MTKPGSIYVVLTAVTPKGERRRYALVSAAAELLCEGGFDAVRHRAVAQRAGLPLASTTYYFSSLDDLIEKAVEHVGESESQQLRLRVSALSRRRRGADATADLLVDLLVGDGNRASDQLISRYERYIACARQPGLRDVQRRILKQRSDAVVEVVERSGRSVRAELLTAANSPRAEVADIMPVLSRSPQLPQADQLGRLAAERGATDIPTLPSQARLAWAGSAPIMEAVRAS